MSISACFNFFSEFNDLITVYIFVCFSLYCKLIVIHFIAWEKDSDHE